MDFKKMMFGPDKFEPKPVKDPEGHEHKPYGDFCEFCGIPWVKCHYLKSQKPKEEE